MEKAILIAGDLDFRPVVEALVRRGVFVEVWYERKSIAAELPGAADFGRPLDFHSLYGWSDAFFSSSHELPRVDRAHGPVVRATLLRSGLLEGRKVELVKESNRADLVLRVERPDGVYWFEHKDQGVLERYFSIVYGTVAWQ